MVEIRHYSPGLRATRCWTDVEDRCPRKPVVRVVTELFARHYCSTCFAHWKNRVRDMAAALGEGTDGGAREGAREWFEERLRRRVAEELAAILEDEAKEKVRGL